MLLCLNKIRNKIMGTQPYQWATSCVSVGCVQHYNLSVYSSVSCEDAWNLALAAAPAYCGDVSHCPIYGGSCNYVVKGSCMYIPPLHQYNATAYCCCSN